MKRSCHKDLHFFRGRRGKGVCHTDWDWCHKTKLDTQSQINGSSEKSNILFALLVFCSQKYCRLPVLYSLCKWIKLCQALKRYILLIDFRLIRSSLLRTKNRNISPVKPAGSWHSPEKWNSLLLFYWHLGEDPCNKRGRELSGTGACQSSNVFETRSLIKRMNEWFPEN